MREILNGIRRIVLSALGCRSEEVEPDVPPDSRFREEMAERLHTLKTSAARIMSDSYRVERMLQSEQDKLAQIEAEARAAARAEIGSRIECCRSRVDELSGELKSARERETQVREQIAALREELRQARQRARSARLQLQISQVRTQLETLAMESSLDDLDLTQLEDRAHRAQSKADALAELNQTLRHPDDSGV